MNKYIKISVEGTRTNVDKKMTLEEMQGWVGGLIEYAPKYMGDNVNNIICNEEGLLLGLPQNKAFPLLVGNVILEIL